MVRMKPPLPSACIKYSGRARELVQLSIWVENDQTSSKGLLPWNLARNRDEIHVEGALWSQSEEITVANDLLGLDRLVGSLPAGDARTLYTVRVSLPYFR